MSLTCIKHIAIKTLPVHTAIHKREKKMVRSDKHKKKFGRKRPYPNWQPPEIEIMHEKSSRTHSYPASHPSCLRHGQFGRHFGFVNRPTTSPWTSFSPPSLPVSVYTYTQSLCPCPSWEFSHTRRSCVFCTDDIGQAPATATTKRQPLIAVAP